MKSLKEFTNLQEDIKPYNILIIGHSAAGVRDTGRETPSTPLIIDWAKKLGIKVQYADFVGLHIEKVSDGHLVHSFPLDKDLYPLL